MNGRLTESEWQRIAEFAETPKHQRCPEQLLPDCSEALSETRDGAEGARRDK
ncbi:hypothetical protein OB920_14965 [Halobacteria archaeon HArc-gm2]|nr:hypothetical protein [Halobacteria archaeon HArc-gm2]